MKLDIKKAFDSVNNIFLIKALDKYGFKEDFMKRIRILIQNQNSWIINAGTSTNYFKCKNGTIQINPISAYVFTLVLAITFFFIIQNKNTNVLNIFEKKNSMKSVCR